MPLIAEEALERIGRCRRVCVFTGAGVSAESGIPTFRDSGGLWENYRLEDLVTPEAFDREPIAVWRWHAWLQGLCFDAQPNTAHEVLAKLDAKYPDYLLITQNIDDLHERAGTRRMVKIHGDIMETRCLGNGHITRAYSPYDKDAMISRETLPRCTECGGLARPNVVWFGEMLPIEPLNVAWEFSGICDLFVIVGTSGTVSGGYGFTELAKRAGALILEVNPQESALTHLADYFVKLPAAQALPEIFQDIG